MAWTEKIWASIARTDGSLQIDFGLGKYQNRGIIDGFGGDLAGREQWTVRGSRELASAPEDIAVGPVQLRDHRAAEAGAVPARTQRRAADLVRPRVLGRHAAVLRGAQPRPQSPHRHAIDVDVIRYHQGGWASGTVTVDGETHEVRPEEWFGFRDHSWGVRQASGSRRPISSPSPGDPPGVRGGIKWTPSFFRRPDGTYYETAIFVVEGAWEYGSAYLNEADGSQAPRPQRHAAHELRHPDAVRAGGELHPDDGVGESSASSRSRRSASPASS